ncbi:hypothetical protein I5M27_13555 [Adhaeribacter sp. BT258]|uniref:Periplasmic heavy metal sensor n=1 Tax=Adhaeribacter terrigena TaxID=2793070 RepID=A0ABS1C617_9BACT|nr:hypothetical protein [Adhaeribacter terrigena]MBK0404015.1 hypothetical protein [Adhaeribacter terrigena]
MKKILLSLLLVFATTLGFAQSTKTKTKSKTTTPAKTAVKKPVTKKTAAEKLPQETPEQKAEREKMAIEKGRALTQNMDKNLRFSPEQFEAVLKINQQSIAQVELAKFQYLKKMKKMNAEIQNIGASRLSLLKDVLTPQQFQKYNQKREEKMGMPGTSPQQQRVPAMEQHSN